MSTKTKRAAATPRRPEKKYGPFAGGCGVVVWMNQVETDTGTRFFRTYVAYRVMWSPVSSSLESMRLAEMGTT